MEKNILSEEIRKIYSLMGIKKSLLNEDDEDLGIETPSQTKTPKGKSSDPMGSFNFGAFGPIYYVKNGFKPFYLTNPVDIGKLFGLGGISNIGEDYYGYFEEFEKKSWTETNLINVTSDGSTPNPHGSIPKIKRYFPTPKWSDFQYLIDNKIPFGFKNNDKYYTLIIKLTDANASVFPEDSDDSRGWTMSFPGMLGAGDQDYGSPYYEVGSLEQYNMVAPKVEGDPSTFALDTRSGLDKFMDSAVGQLSVMAVAVTAAILTRGVAARLIATPGSALFTTNAMRIQTTLVIAGTIGEASVNIPQAVYYFMRGGEHTQVGFLCLAFCALPLLSKQPGFIKLIGQEYDQAVCHSLAVKAVGNAAKIAARGGEQNFFEYYQTLTMTEKAYFMNFLENYKNNPNLITDGFKQFIQNSEDLKIIKNGVVPEATSNQWMDAYALYVASLEIQYIIKSPTESFISTFSKNIAGVVVLQQFILGAYNKFIKKKEVSVALEKDKNLEKKFIKNAKKVDEDLRNKLSSFEKLVMTDNKLPDFQVYMYDLTEDHTVKMFFDGVLPDEYYDKLRKIGIQTAIKVGKKEIKDADKKIDRYTEAGRMAVNYLSTVVCWADIVSAGYETEASEILIASERVKTDDNTICNSERKAGPDHNKSCTTSPCWVKKTTTDETTINPNVTTATTINPNVTTDETTIKSDTSKNRYLCRSGKCIDVGEGKGRYPTPDCNNTCTSNKKVNEPLNPEETMINKPGYGEKK